MLHDFMTRERNPILKVAKQKASESLGTRVSSEALEDGWGIFLDELIGLLKRDEPFEFHGEKGLHTHEAEKQGKEYLRLGYTVSEVVHGYGSICQSITGLATKLQYEITPREFQQLNLSLDTAIAEAVSEFDKGRKETDDGAEIKRLGYLSHELRICVQSATIALEMVESGVVGVRSKTGAVLQSSLRKITQLIDIALTEVRLRSEPEWRPQRTRVFDLMSEVGVTAGFEARSGEMSLRMQGSSKLEVDVDRQLLISALANLVQNAMKFSKPGASISVRTRKEGDRVLIEVEDECGGLPQGRITELLEPRDQKGSDGAGIGQGLAISRLAIERNNGQLRVENLPGKGCIFIIDLPEAAPLPKNQDNR